MQFSYLPPASSLPHKCNLFFVRTRVGVGIDVGVVVAVGVGGEVVGVKGWVNASRLCGRERRLFVKGFQWQGTNLFEAGWMVAIVVEVAQDEMKMRTT